MWGRGAAHDADMRQEVQGRLRREGRGKRMGAPQTGPAGVCTLPGANREGESHPQAGREVGGEPEGSGAREGLEGRSLEEGGSTDIRGEGGQGGHLSPEWELVSSLIWIIKDDTEAH